MARSSFGRGRASLGWALLLSVAAHTGVGFYASAPRPDRASLAATLVAVGRADAPAPFSATTKMIAPAPRADPPPDPLPAEQTPRARTARRPVNSAPLYYPPAELDKRAYPLAMLDFPYPPVVGAGLQGTLELTLYVGKEGIVDRVEVDSASVDRRLVDLAAESLRATPFSPGERRGRAVGARLRLAIDYALVAR